MHEGEDVEVFDGRGHAAHGKVSELGKDLLRISIEHHIDGRESPLRITLAAAIIQLDKFELVLQKATELGVAAIIPVITDRIEVRAERYRGKEERWRKIVFEAVKQSGRAVIPPVTEPARFDEIAKKDSLKIVFDADQAADALPRRPTDLIVLIGPEGGWSEREIAVARERGCIFQRLGPRRLRAETAAITAVSIVAERFGDL